MAQSSVSAPSVSRWATRLARNRILFAPAHRQLYATLISNRDLLMLQVHAVSVVDVPEIGAAFRKGASNDRQVREEPFRRSRRCGATVLRLRPVMPLDHDDIA